jgi:TolB-like protein
MSADEPNAGVVPMKLPSRLVRLIRELRRRRVLQASAVYVTGAFVAVQVAANVFPALQFPPWTQTLVVVVAIAGFPVVVALWWAFRITPEGIRRTVERDEEAEVLQARGTPWVALALVAVVAIASAGLGWAAWDLWLDPGSEARASAAEESARGEDSLRPSTVAVLPFQDGSRDGSLGHIARALSRDLSHQLNQIDALDVISERGTSAHGDPDVPADSLARVLDAGSLVTGTVEPVGDRIRLRVQLVDGENGRSLMSREFTAHRDSVLTLRNDLVGAAVRELRRRLGEEVAQERTRGSTPHLEAWELYHRAEDRVQEADSLRHAGATELAGGLYRKADSLYLAARRIDDLWLAPRLARGWLAYKRARLGGARITSTDPDGLRRGIEIADRILEDRPGNAAALELRGVLWSWLSKVEADDTLLERAEEDLYAAVIEESGRARAWAELAEVRRARGEFEEARTAWEEARKADAFLAYDGDVLRLGSHLALELGELETALEWAERGQRRFPEAATYPQLRLLAYPMDGAPQVSPDSVWAVLGELEERAGGSVPSARVWVAAALARFGLADSARSVLNRALASSGEEHRRNIAYYEPKVWLNLGDTARAVDGLREAVERYGWPREYMAEDSWWKPLRGDSAFRALVGSGR